VVGGGVSVGDEVVGVVDGRLTTAREAAVAVGVGWLGVAQAERMTRGRNNPIRSNTPFPHKTFIETGITFFLRISVRNARK
jgi:hypothetical protein